MAFIGKIVKKVIDVANDVLPEKDAGQSQRDTLLHLLKEAENTAFGRHFDFAAMRKATNPQAAFRQKVPLYSYERMLHDWWQRTIDGEADIAWPGKPEYFALSSGTTSHSKRIPVTGDMLASIRKTGINQALALANFDVPAQFFEKEMMMLGSSTDLEERNGALEGEISGISASNIPFWFRSYYKPGTEISAIEDWDTRVQHIAEKATEWDIGALSGIPSWIELMLKKVIEHHGLNTIHDIWPNLSVYTTGGVAFEPYRKSFSKLLEHELIYIDTYLASEGFLAYQERPNADMAMKLSLNAGVYFEFVPFEDQYFDDAGAPLEDAPAVGIESVEKDKDYAIIISTVSGAWRYSIGDTVKFTDVERCEIKITGRTKHFLNVVGSQLSVNRMNEAMGKLEEQFGVSIPEFTVAAVQQEDNFIHRWYLGLGDESHPSDEELASALDEILKNDNKNYAVARTKALTGVEVVAVPADAFYRYSEKNKKKGGQIKVPRLMKEEALEQWEQFVQSEVK
jgi:hypothetical protein